MTPPLQHNPSPHRGTLLPPGGGPSSTQMTVGCHGETGKGGAPAQRGPCWRRSAACAGNGVRRPAKHRRDAYMAASGCVSPRRAPSAERRARFSDADRRGLSRKKADRPDEGFCYIGIIFLSRPRFAPGRRGRASVKR